MRKLILLLFIFMQLSSSIKGQSTTTQNPVEDSLLQKLKTTLESEARFNLLLDLSYHTIRYSLEKSETYIEQAKKLAEEQKNELWVAETKGMMARIATNKGNSDEALLLLDDCLNTYKKQKDITNIIKTLNGLGIVHRRKGNFIQSVQLLEEATEYFSTENVNELTKGKILQNLSNSYENLNLLTQATETLFEALEYFEKVNAQINIGQILGNLGLLYHKQRQIESAIEYFEKSLTILKKENDLLGQINAFTNLAAVYKELESYQKELDLRHETLKLSKQLGATDRIWMAQLGIAATYISMKKHNKALKILDALDTTEIRENLYYQYLYNDKRIIIYTITKEYQKGIKYALRNQELSKKMGTSKYLPAILFNLQNLYYNDNQLNKAYKYLLAYQAAKDSIVNESNIAALTTERLKFEFEKEQTVVQLEKEALESKIRIQGVTRWSLTGLLILSVLIGYLIIRDFRKRNQMLAQDLENKKIIETQAQKLQNLYDYKNKLFANIAHELRTPLTLIISPIQSLLREKNITQKQTESLYLADKNIRLLSSTVHQILDLAKRDNVELAIQIIDFDLNQLIHFVANDFDSMAQFKSIQFSKPTRQLPIPVKTDGEKLMIVIRNLLSNAFKFTSKNEHISINMTDLGDEVIINVEDTGKGIPSEDIPKIFDRHFQVNPANLPNEGGMGIGLAISKEYMTLINGSIHLESKFNTGSVFTIRFPKQLDKNASNNPEANAIFNTLISPKPVPTFNTISSQTAITTTQPNEITNILIVEDNMDMSNYLNSILSEEHNLHFVQDGQQALGFLEKNQPDLIISDYMMPNMDGLELLNQLKSHSNYAAIPVIMLTAQQAMDIKLNALRIGVDDYLTKPFDNRELTIRVNTILNNQSNIKADQEATPTKDSRPKMNLEDLAWLEDLEKVALEYVYNMNFSVNELADRMSVSYSAIFVKVKKLTGLTPNQYLRELRLQEARRLLEIKKYSSVKAVSYSVGYRDVKHFSKNFKKRFGKNPSEYLV